MNERRLGAASAGLFAATAVANLSMVLYHRVLSQALGPDYAHLVAMLALINVLGNITLGLNTFLVKAFSADAEIRGPGAVKTRLLSLLKPGLLGLGASTLVLAALAPWLTAYLKLPSTELTLMVAMVFASGVLLLALRAATQGLHHFGWLGVSLSGEGVARVGVLGLPAAQSVAGGMWALLVGQVAGAACSLGGLVGLGTPRRPLRRTQGEGGWRRALREGGADTLALTLLALVGYLDVMVLKHHYTDERASLYSRAALVAKSFLYLPGALNMVLLAAAARRLAGGRDPRPLLEKFLLASLALDVLGLAGVWLLTPLCLSLLAGSNPLFQTPEMLALTRWFSLAVVPLGLLQMVTAYLLAIRRRGVALGMAVLALVYWAALQLTWPTELAVVTALGICSTLALAGALWMALARPPRRGEWRQA